jgi:hypothetical protein
MNINDMTIGQAKELAAMVSSHAPAQKALIGEYVIVRCRDAGVHAGTLIDYEGRTVILKNSRRLWYWVCANNQISLSGVASEGVVEKESKIPAVVGTLILSDACEILETTPQCQESIERAPVYEVD